MLEISDLGLTFFQIAEVNNADPGVVAAWLESAGQPEIRNPAGFFLTGLRSGMLPDSDRPERAHLVLHAERWVEQVGILYDQESAVLGELFDRNGILRHHAGDVQLQKRMLSLWAKGRPSGEQVEREQRERAVRNKATYFALREKT
jgi:hypothetical protein